MRHQNRTFATSLGSTLILTGVFIASSVTGIPRAEDPAGGTYKVVSPQVVATSEIETTFVLSNRLFDETCEVQVSYHLVCCLINARR